MLQLLWRLITIIHGAREYVWRDVTVELVAEGQPTLVKPGVKSEDSWTNQDGANNAASSSGVKNGRSRYRCAIQNGLEQELVQNLISSFR